MKKLVYLFLFISSVSFSQITSVAGYDFDKTYIYETTEYEFVTYDTLDFESVFEFEGKEYFVTKQDITNRELLWEEGNVFYEGSYRGGVMRILTKKPFLFLVDTSGRISSFDSVAVINLDTMIQVNSSFYVGVKVHDYWLGPFRNSRTYVSSNGYLIKKEWFEQEEIIKRQVLVDLLDESRQSIVTALEDEIVESELLETTYYSTNGVLLENPQKGIPIIKMEKYSTNGEVEYKRSLFILD